MIYTTINSPIKDWIYGQVAVDELNVRRLPSTSAKRWNNVWPHGRIILIKDATDGWYESLYRGKLAYVAKEYITILNAPVHTQIVDRMLFMAIPELGRDNAKYFNGYSGAWCHRFADWLAMNAGMPITRIPNNSNCGSGIVWFINNINSGGFFFKNPTHKSRFVNNYRASIQLSPNLTAADIAYVPIPGDYVYFRWNKAGKNVSVNHVGIVSSVESNMLSTWEGNSSHKVVQKVYPLGAAEIIGFGHPRYNVP